MIKTFLALVALTTVVVVVSCSSTTTPNSNPDAQGDSAPAMCPPGTYVITPNHDPSCFRLCDHSTIPTVNDACPAGYELYQITCYVAGDGGPTNTCGGDAGSDAKSPSGDAPADKPAASGDAAAVAPATCPPSAWKIGDAPSCYRECDFSTVNPTNGKCPDGYQYLSVSCYAAGDGRPASTCGHDAGDAQSGS
jgi:hypothetical protein